MITGFVASLADQYLPGYDGVSSRSDFIAKKTQIARLTRENKREFRSVGMSKDDISKMMKLFMNLVPFRTPAVTLSKFLHMLDMENTPFTRRVFNTFDYNSQKGVQFRDFGLTIWTYCTLEKSEMQIFAFDIYDLDKSGTLDRAEIVQMLSDLFGKTEKELQKTKVFKKALAHIDRLNSSGKGGMELTVSFDVFLQFLTKHQMLFFPAFQFQQQLREKTFGLKYWKRQTKKVQKLKRKKKIPDIHELRPALKNCRDKKYEPTDGDRIVWKTEDGEEDTSEGEEVENTDTEQKEEPRQDILPPLKEGLAQTSNLSLLNDIAEEPKGDPAEDSEDDIEFLPHPHELKNFNTKEPHHLERPAVLLNTLGMNETRRLRTSNDVYRPGSAATPHLISSTHMTQRRRKQAQTFTESFRPSTSPAPSNAKLAELNVRPSTAAAIMGKNSSYSLNFASSEPVGRQMRHSQRPQSSSSNRVGKSISNSNLSQRSVPILKSYHSFGNDPGDVGADFDGFRSPGHLSGSIDVSGSSVPDATDGALSAGKRSLAKSRKRR